MISSPSIGQNVAGDNETVESGCRPSETQTMTAGHAATTRMGLDPETELLSARDSEVSRHAPRILLAEDDNEMRSLMAHLLRRDGYEVVECPNGVGLLDYLSTFLGRSEPEHFDLVISDIRMPGLSGLEVVGGLHRRPDFPPAILMTAFGDAETHAEAKEIGVAAMFDKPFDMHELMAKVRETVPRWGGAGSDCGTNPT
ncbi:MAG TPA: response regulator [Phycisphaerae bacterium]|nr:response regulator [Phycisphaerae bacterium]